MYMYLWSECGNFVHLLLRLVWTNDWLGHSFAKAEWRQVFHWWPDRVTPPTPIRLLVYEEASLDKRKIWYLRYGSSAQIATVVGRGIQNDDYMYLTYIKVRTYALYSTRVHTIYTTTLWLTLKLERATIHLSSFAISDHHSRTSCGTNPFYLGTPEAHATLV